MSADSFNDASNELNRGADELQKGAAGATAHGQAALDDALGAAEKAINEGARRLERVLKDGVEALRVQTQAYAGTATEQLDEAQRYVLERVKDRPMTATLAGLGVGVLVGLLLSSRSK